ncbi:MAG: cytidylate kinase-like family protein [Pseudomonadota bacterium]
MKGYSGKVVYKPGQYGKRRLSTAEWTSAQIQKWDSERQQAAQKPETKTIHPTICFSRKIGVGALEIADLLAEKLGYRVIDREIMEHMASQAELAEKTVQFFDERYPGKMSEFMSFLLGEKSFIKSDYARQLAKSVFALASLEPTIFVGRGAHLLLPRDKVLAVRFICSDPFRVKRVSEMMGINESEAKERLGQIDKEQRDFFKNMYDKKDAVPYEFDLVINRDHIGDSAKVAAIVACAFEQKFKK